MAAESQMKLDARSSRFLAVGRLWISKTGAQTILATLVIFGWLGACWYKAPAPKTIWYYDAPVYLSIAYDIDHFGRFTDGSNWGTPSVDPTRPSAMTRSPLDPIFLATAAEIDPVFGETLDCLVDNALAPSCPQRAPLPRAIQFLMTVGVYLMLWRIAFCVTSSLRVAWLSLAVASFTGPILIHYAQTLMTETLCLFFTTAATLAAVELIKSDRLWRLTIFAGVMVGLAALTRPNFLYFFPAIAIGAVPFIVRSANWKRGTAMLAAFLIAGFLVITPWLVRNTLVLGQTALTANYAQMALTQRVAFNEMSWREFGLFNLCSLPDGTGMGSLLIGPHACDPFGNDMKPDTFYRLGSTAILHSDGFAAGGTKYIIYHYIILHPFWHALVSIPMAMRGLWIDHYWGFVLTIFCLPLTLRALRELDAATLVVTLPGWFMLAFYAALSANQTRFNLMMIIPLAFSGGMALDRLLQRISWPAGSPVTASTASTNRTADAAGPAMVTTPPPASGRLTKSETLG